MSGSKKEVNYSKQKMKSRIAWIIASIFAVFWLLVALIPFIFMILNSLRKQFDMLSQGVFHLIRGIVRTIRILLPMEFSDISYEA